MSNKKDYSGLISLIEEGNLSYEEIGAKYNISKQRVCQIVQNNKVLPRVAVNRKLKSELINKVNELAENNKIIELNTVLHNNSIYPLKLKDGKTIIEFLRSERNKEITNKFINGVSAIDIIDDKVEELSIPNKISCVNYVYKINNLSGVKRFSNIGDRSLGGIFEVKSTIDLIVKLRDIDKLRFSKILAILNEKNIKTVTNLDFTLPNLIAKYHQIKKYM